MTSSCRLKNRQLKATQPPPIGSREAWIAPLVIAVAIQTVVTGLQRIPPTLAPVLTERVNVAPSFIGYLAAVWTLGSIVFFLTGLPLIRRIGDVRSMQLGVLLAVFGTALLAIPNSTVIVLATFLVGFGSGPCVPAASDLLQRHAPKSLRALIFSIKQAGVPLGGMLAGFLLPPLALIDWRLVIVAAVVLTLGIVAATQPFRAALDRDRNPSQSLSPAIIFSPDNLLAPMRALRLSPLLTPLTYAAFCLAVAQSATFAFLVTFAVMRLGFDLVVAGVLFAVLQAAGIAGRVLLGGAADWIGSATGLVKATVIASTITTTLLAFAAPEWPLWALWALIGITGVTVASWNGLVIADFAAIVPPERVAEAATGVSIVLFAGSVVGPIGFALVLDASGSYQPAFLMLSAWSLSAALFFMRKPR